MSDAELIAGSVWLAGLLVAFMCITGYDYSARWSRLLILIGYAVFGLNLIYRALT